MEEIVNYKMNILLYYKYNMFIVYVNINSIWNKIDEVKLLLNEGLFYIFVILEIKLDFIYNSFFL